MGFVAALLYALLMAALPLVEVVHSGRPPGTLLLMYWFETVLLLVTGSIRIVAHRRATAKTGHYAPTTVVSKADADSADVLRELGDGSTYLRHFVGLTTVFTVVHGLFVALLVFLFNLGGPVTWADAGIALAWVVAVQVAWLAWDLTQIAHWSFVRLGEFCGQASIRVLVTQLGLILGFPVVGITGSAWGMIGTFVGLRALADACIGGLQGLMKRRDLPPGLKAFLAKRGKQTADEIEAEFDAMRDRGREVEALLERPIGEVRTPAAARAAGPAAAG
ncbi:MAG TPA: DUF6498-containing protein [Casimicrobiaceae bacterium]|jgi:hypothetical protein